MRTGLMTLAAACAALALAVTPALALDTRDASNPLGVPGPYNGNPLAGAPLYVDPASPAAQAMAGLSASNPSWVPLLNDIASEPGAHRFYMWNMGSTVETQVAQYMQESQIEHPGTTVMLSTYNLVHGACGTTATSDFVPTWENFIDQVAQGIGNFHAVFFLELDSLIATPCLSQAQLATRESELRYAVNALEADPHVLVYLDGGAADAQPVLRQAQLLQASGVAQAQGFFLNSTHFDWTTNEIAYGEEISKLLGGAHFIINTGENGQGPLKPANPITQGNEVLCNPPGRGLGPLSVSQGVAQQTGYPNLDGLLWFTNPGGSGGQCVPGAPPTGVFWPSYAVMLATNWVNQVNGPQVPWTPEVSATPNPLRFGRVKLGKASRLRPMVEYVNGAGGLFMGSGASVSGPDKGDFKVLQNGCDGRSLNKSQSCHLTVRFTPKRTGNRQATLVVAVQPPGLPVLLPLSGTGVAAPSHHHKRKK